MTADMNAEVTVCRFPALSIVLVSETCGRTRPIEVTRNNWFIHIN